MCRLTRYLYRRWISDLLARLSLLSTLLLLLPATQTLAGDSLDWSVTPYIWATETQYKLKFDGSPVDSGTVTFDDLIDTTDASFQLVTEAGWSDGHWSAFADVTYFDASDTYKGPLVRVDSDSEQWLVDVAVAWWPGGEARGLNLFVGARYTDLDDSYDFKVVGSEMRLGVVDNSRDFVDALIGVRQRFTLAERWSLLTRADYSNGDSEGIWQMQALVRYALGKGEKYGLMFGYRYKKAKFEYNNLEEDNEYYGPLLGFNFRF